MIGELIDHYRVLELLGRGNMGVVYKALDVNLDRQVAIKVMSAEARDDPDFVERFRQEARMQGALNHPNVAMLFDYFVHDGAPVVVMEFIDGESMEQMIRRRGAIPVRECIPLFKQALGGVAAAHRAGIVHRDLKPSNLMVTRDGTVKVMDFGIAKRQGAPGATRVSSTSIGSPLYMAPEQILGRPVDCRTDVYALGLTLYELLTGCRPFNPRGKAEYMVLNAHVNDTPEPPTVYRYGIPQPIVDAVMRALAKDPATRFQSADEFMQALPDAGALAAAAAAMAAPTAAAPDGAARPAGPTGTVALEPQPPAPRAGPTGTLVLEPCAAPPASGPTGTLVLPREAAAPAAGPTGTLVLEPQAAGGTTAIEYTPMPARRVDPSQSMVVDFSAGTVWQQLHPPEPARLAVVADPSAQGHVAIFPEPHAATHGLRKASRPWLARGGGLGAVAALLAVIAFGAVLRHGARLHAAHAAAASEAGLPPPAAQGQAVPETQTPTESTEPPAPAPATAVPSVAEAAPAAAPLAPPAPATGSAPPLRQGLSGTWSGEYVDASGKRLLRVVNLSISRVQPDGGIEGTLEYQADSGNGECKLHPRGSTWVAGERRLQLSPEACSPHHPRELGVPLDFAGVNPGANTLKDGRIEAPTGEVIRVKLKRVSGV